MQFNQFLTFGIATLLSVTPTLACQCFANGVPDNARTLTCCGEVNGISQPPDQCQAASISESLREFRSCCGGQSDCDFPGRRDGDETAFVA
ncbi:hypothetical protein JX265_001678 [Neoarthrinium moseri]|uniref:Extracellular membrane protein CFEM domain-containing protein n=1 Tax=Neoarthrinium moseri TaxID=1658444 RepID=A0A9P9WVU3_9PEZI|nr:uncharacterized protein JN550_005251 [Neoarthrinium moseri]KAI1842964.1 hypothetical protein JX266_010817 [Neoarthrinium moseri]KAI1870323.1 hypothetical protein JN550_005251 [Neoarthrinium moseri]KAI1880057.1 hypothetical protein JX265_001678 [Neoarthrinium moseri]